MINILGRILPVINIINNNNYNYSYCVIITVYFILYIYLKFAIFFAFFLLSIFV